MPSAKVRLFRSGFDVLELRTQSCFKFGGHSMSNGYFGTVVVTLGSRPLFQHEVSVIKATFLQDMMTSSNGNLIRVTGLLWGEFTGHQKRPATRSFDVFFDLRPNKRLSKQSGGWWFEMPSRPLRRHSNEVRKTL